MEKCQTPQTLFFPFFPFFFKYLTSVAQVQRCLPTKGLRCCQPKINSSVLSSRIQSHLSYVDGLHKTCFSHRTCHISLSRDTPAGFEVRISWILVFRAYSNVTAVLRASRNNGWKSRAPREL